MPSFHPFWPALSSVCTSSRQGESFPDPCSEKVLDLEKQPISISNNRHTIIMNGPCYTYANFNVWKYTSSSDIGACCWIGTEFWVRVVVVVTTLLAVTAIATGGGAVAAAVELEWDPDAATMLSREEWEEALEPSVIGRVAGGSFSAAIDISNWSIRLHIEDQKSDTSHTRYTSSGRLTFLTAEAVFEDLWYCWNFSSWWP